LVVVACFLPCRAKDLSAPLRNYKTTIATASEINVKMLTNQVLLFCV